MSITIINNVLSPSQIVVVPPLQQAFALVPSTIAIDFRRRKPMRGGARSHRPCFKDIIQVDKKSFFYFFIILFNFGRV